MEVLTNIADKIGFDWRLSLSHTINLLIIFFLLVKFAFPAIKKNVEERTKKIKEGLAMREDADKILNQAKADALDVSKTANAKSQEIIAKSELNSKQIIAEANNQKSEIIKEAELAKADSRNAGLKDAENIIKKDVAKILTKISENAFSTKITADINSDFIAKVFSK